MKNIVHSKLLAIRNLTESTYVLKLEKLNFEFKAGQYLVLNVPGEYKAREYSIYSPEEAPTIDLLIKEVDKGEVSRELKYMKIGTKVEITGPFGFLYSGIPSLRKPGIIPLLLQVPGFPLSTALFSRIQDLITMLFTE